MDELLAGEDRVIELASVFFQSVLHAARCFCHFAVASSVRSITLETDNQVSPFFYILMKRQECLSNWDSPCYKIVIQ